MGYTSKEARNANQRQWRVVNRANRALLGLCRDCPRTCTRTTRQTVLCDYCYMKAYERRPDALGEFNAMKQGLRADAMPLRDDRRQGGKPCHALAWALHMRNA